MSKNLPCIKVNDNTLDHLRDYFFNNYKGEEFSIILKGSFYIKFYAGNRYVKFLVSQELDNTVITSVDDNNNKKPISIIIHDNKFAYDYKENCYMAKASVVTQIIGQEDKIEKFEKELSDLFSYIVVFFANEQENIPYSLVYNKTKKKQKKLVREYDLSKEFVLKKVKLAFCDNKSYEDFGTFIELKTSVYYSERLEELMERENFCDIEPLFIPFKDFKLSFDKNITEVFCHVSENDKTLECLVFKNKLKNFALKISLEKDPNRNFNIFTFDDFNKFNTDDFSPFELAKDVIHLMVINFFYFTHYKVIVDKNEKLIKNNVVTESGGGKVTSETSSTTKHTNIYLNASKVYNISKALKTNAEKRKKPEYRKFSWQVRGHMRRLASGKVIYIAPYTCKRKRNKVDEKDTKRYIINV